MNVNKVILYGNLTRDPELRQTTTGLAVASLGLATNRIYNNQNRERVEEVEYHNVTLFGKLAENANQYLRKGSGVFIEGRLKTSSWETDGVKKYKTEIIAENMQFGPRTVNSQNSQPQQPQNNNKDMPTIDPSDIPF